uniref:hypothetical protein n=1 Tax=Alysiella crassa TaxID=153491 RepID=UPI001B80DC0F
YSRRTEKAVRRCQLPYVLGVHGGRCRLVLHFHFYDYTKIRQPENWEMGFQAAFLVNLWSDDNARLSF